MSASSSVATNNGRIDYLEFEAGCKRYISWSRTVSPSSSAEGGARGSLGSRQYAVGWEWHDAPAAGQAHLTLKTGGGMARWYHVTMRGREEPAGTDALESSEEEMLEQDDDVTVLPPPPVAQVVCVRQSITWSSTWRVPVLYFQAAKQDGQPLSLDELLASPLLHRQGTLDTALQAEQVPSSASLGSASYADAPAVFPSISHGHDPLTDCPSFYLHPCETAGFLQTVLSHSAPSSSIDAEEARSADYIASFVMLCSTAIEMRP